MDIRKENLSDETVVRSKVTGGVKKMTDLVALTLGPHGRSILIERGMGEPLIVDDGRRTAENVKFDDPVQHLAARICYDVTRKTDEKAGDGTTTSMVLTNAIVDYANNHLIKGDDIIGVTVDVNQIDKDLHTSLDFVLKELDVMAKPVKTEKQLIDVATISTGDAELGKKIGQMYHKLGKDGHITLEFNLTGSEIETDVVKGYRFSGGYARSWMVTDEVRKVASFKDVPVLVAHDKKLDVEKIQGVAKEVANTGKKAMVIIAPKFPEDFVKSVYNTAVKTGFVFLCVYAPSRGMEAYKDMAIYTGAKLFTENDDLSLAVKKDLGFVESIDVTDDTTIMTGGAGKPKDVKARIAEVEAEAAIQKVPQFKQDRFERASALDTGVGVIRIGAPTDDARNFLKHKIEDAKYATKFAYKYGVVPGGGQAFKKIAEKLEDGDILKTALLAPYETLKRNAGGKLKIGANVIDPVHVEKTAIEHAVSAASKLIRVGGSISMVRPSVVEELGTIINQGGEEE